MKVFKSDYMEPDFALNFKTSRTGGLICHMKIVPAHMVAIFGTAGRGVSLDHKVTGEWVFHCVEDPNIVFWVYDYKQTFYYHESQMTHDQFWAQTEVADLHVGCSGKAHDHLPRFRRWLSYFLDEYLPPSGVTTMHAQRMDRAREMIRESIDHLWEMMKFEVDDLDADPSHPITRLYSHLVQANRLMGGVLTSHEVEWQKHFPYTGRTICCDAQVDQNEDGKTICLGCNEPVFLASLSDF